MEVADHQRFDQAVNGQKIAPMDAAPLFGAQKGL